MEAKKEISQEELSDILGTTIICDDVNKNIVFLAMLTAYTESDQLSVCLLGQSSSGKTYIPQETAKYFPEEDVREYASVTPTAFKYMADEVSEDGNTSYVNLERVILLFSEMPNSAVLANLRPVLSHDKKETEFVSTDIGSGRQKKARRTIIVGYPAVIFCSANINLNEQEATRSILLSPETSKEKIDGAVSMVIRKNSDPDEYAKSIAAQEKREWLKQRVLYVKNLNIDSVIITNVDLVTDYFSRIAPNSMPRNPRDIAHVMSLIKAIAMLNAPCREVKIIEGKNKLLATISDINEGFSLWSKISRTQIAGLAPAALNFYEKYIVPCYRELKDDIFEGRREDGVTIEDIISFCYKVDGGLSTDRFTITKGFLPSLKRVGLLLERRSKYDGRVKIFSITDSTEELGRAPLSFNRAQSSDDKATNNDNQRPQNYTINKDEIPF